MARSGYNVHMFTINPTQKAVLEELCHSYKVQSLVLFGSVVKGTARSGSDLDVLVEFEPDARIGMMGLSKLSRQLSRLLERQVDLVPRDGLKDRIRDDVLAHTEVLFAA